jgi:GTP pyrophosphokinase
MENKETFQARIKPYFSPSDQLDIKLAYCLSKFGHRAQTRKELTEGQPTRYFEHVRRVSIVLMDEMKIMDRDMIITALLHDSIEDCVDLTPELLEHSFGSNVVSMIKHLSKVPKDGYIERLKQCHNWKILAIKACDRLDNLRSLMVPGTTIEFQKKQIKETKEKYFSIFDKMVKLTPPEYINDVSNVRNEIRRLVERYSTIIEMEENKKCPECLGTGYDKWRNEEDFTLCNSCNGNGKRKDKS